MKPPAVCRPLPMDRRKFILFCPCACFACTFCFLFLPSPYKYEDKT